MKETILKFVGDYRQVELEPFAGAGAENAGIRWLIGQKDGAVNFAMRMIELGPGGHSPFHKHSDEHEIFVWSGEGELRLEGGGRKPLQAGTAVFVPGGEEHQFVNTSGRDKLEFICVIPIRKA